MYPSFHHSLDDKVSVLMSPPIDLVTNGASGEGRFTSGDEKIVDFNELSKSDDEDGYVRINTFVSF